MASAQVFRSFEELGAAFGIQKAVDAPLPGWYSVELPRCSGCNEQFTPQHDGSGLHACADCCEDAIRQALDEAYWALGGDDHIEKLDCVGIRRRMSARFGIKP